MAQYFEVWESMIMESKMEQYSKEYKARAIKAILSGLPDPIKVKVEKCSSAKGMWDNLKDLHSKGASTMTSIHEDDEKQKGNPENQGEPRR